ncbi:acetate--CoA ligase family protein [Sphingobium sp. EP60837]|uniref:acetate--CoA ligase family protein n=1 Tax=Sphingobium sp. EP60837 TaxID=1855519 RepID=UPI0007DCF8E2|nr:acetate--CoA ligase family protein [Sphingobium sp. EP60837]ANI80170.1 Acetate--CoA ligase (ADP-forming) II [Sphingobium sp. EP60837]
MNLESKRQFEALFAPKSIALIGASSDSKKHTSRPQRSLRKQGYEGRIFPINPNRAEVGGDVAYPSLLDVPAAVDHAFIMVPRDAVPAAIEQCVAKNVPVATICTDGFAETGDEGLAIQQQILATARAGGLRLLGPNCSGIYSSTPSCALSINASVELLDVRPGPLAIVSQSGSMTGGLMSRGLGRGVGFSRIVSIGNECDLSVGEITDWLVDDPETGAILLFLETFRKAPDLARAARRAIEAGKQIIAYKLGRSDLGRDLAASHTGAMAGGDEVANAFFRANGILRADCLETLFELPLLLANRRPSAQHRVAVMTTTGGGGALVADRLGTLGVNIVAPTDKVVENLAKKNISISKSRLTDLTLTGTKAEVYGAVASELLASDHCDLVLAVAGSSAQFQPEITVGSLVQADKHGKPLAVFIAPDAQVGLQQLADAGIAGFRTPETCADAVSSWANWAMPQEQPKADPATIEAVEGAISALAGRQPNEFDAGLIFGAIGIQTAPASIIREPGERVDLQFPVVAKILSPDIPHKTDAGGVVLGIKGQDALAEAATQILSRVGAGHPGAAIDGILVQQMERGSLAEAILGFRNDPEVGPIVVLGIGGILAEVYKDAAIRLAPTTSKEARSMIEEVRGLAVIRGYRGLPAGDCDALADAIVSMSRLAEIQGIAEAEINPLFVKPAGQGVVAVDGLVILDRD